MVKILRPWKTIEIFYDARFGNLLAPSSELPHTSCSMLPSIFKSYDIRGLAPEEIDVVGARRVAESLVHVYAPKHVVVGHDMRKTSVELEAAVVEGFISRGVSVTRIGLCSTPLFYFAVGEGLTRYDLGVMVTASHNPAQYNGFKLVKGDCQPIGQGSGMEELRDVACGELLFPSAKQRGEIFEDFEGKTRYLDRVFCAAKLPNEMPTCGVAIDAGNGMNGFLLPDFVSRLPSLVFYPLFWDLDGTFPNHEANPLNLGTLIDLQRTVTEERCAFGVAFDGDGDRVGFVDEKGDVIPGDILTALFAQTLLSEHPGAKILYDLRSSWSVAEVIKEGGGVPIMSRVGHAHIKRQMRVEGALFAGELSMHFYFADFWYAESSDFAVLLLLKILARSPVPLSAVWRPLQRYVHSGEINFSVKDASAVLRALGEAYGAKASQRSTIDGLRFEFRDASAPKSDWWFSVRSSNTEPVVRVNLEARTVEEMERRRAEVVAVLTS